MHRATIDVARWEFSRHFKFRRELVSMIVILALVAGGFWVGRLVARSTGAETITIAVTGVAALPAAPGPDSRLRLELQPDPARARDAVVREEIDAALDLADPDAPALFVRADPRWLGELTSLLTTARVEARMRNAGLTPESLAQLLAPVALDVQYDPAAREPSTRADRVAAGIAIGLMIMGIWVGQAYLFLAITGERTLRVTEQVVAAIPPQAWMDGKILGLSGVALANLAGYGVVSLLTLPMSRAAGFALPMPDAAASPALLALFLLFAVLGFLFWNCVIAAIASIIDDPNTSNRGGFLMAPLIPVMFAFFAIRAPDAAVVRLLGLVPVTSPPVMAARLALTEVPAWEVALSLVLLAGSVWLLRLAAGRIFRTGILMYGKEPSWREVWRWVR